MPRKDWSKMAQERSTKKAQGIPPATPFEVANCSRLNVRAKPDTSSDVVTIVNKGSKLYSPPTEIVRQEGWLCVYGTTADGDEFTGFCKEEYLKELKISDE